MTYYTITLWMIAINFPDYCNMEEKTAGQTVPPAV